MRQYGMFFIVGWLIPFLTFAQAPQSKRLSIDFYLSEEYQLLRKEIISVTEQYYKAHQLRDRDKIDSLTHDDYQYLHDLNGDYVPKRYAAKQEKQPEIKRLYGRGNRPIPGTIKVFPINRYMAMLTMRSVYTNVRYTDGAVFDLGIVDQILEFKQLDDGLWQVSRHYSVDHHPDYNGNQADRKEIDVDEKTLKQFVGKYKVSYNLYCTVSMDDSGLKLSLNTTDDEISAGPYDLFAESSVSYFRKEKWVDWVYEFRRLEDDDMSLTIHCNDQFFGFGERVSH